MSLRGIHDRCTELLTLASDEWLVTPEEQHSASRHRITTLIDDIRDRICRHNAAVVRVVRRHHPDEGRIRLSQLPAGEQFAAKMHQIDMPGVEPYLPLDAETEAVLAALPTDVALAHRFAVHSLHDVESLMREAEMVHVLNRTGERMERIPMPGSIRTSTSMA